MHLLFAVLITCICLPSTNLTSQSVSLNDHPADPFSFTQKRYAKFNSRDTKNSLPVVVSKPLHNLPCVWVDAINRKHENINKGNCHLFQVSQHKIAVIQSAIRTNPHITIGSRLYIERNLWSEYDYKNGADLYDMVERTIKENKRIGFRIQLKYFFRQAN